MNNRERLEYIKSLKNRLRELEEAKKKVADDIKRTKGQLEDITNNLVNELLREEISKDE